METRENNAREVAAANLDRLQQLGPEEQLLEKQENESFGEWEKRCTPLKQERDELIRDLFAYLTENPVIIVKGRRIEILINHGKDIHIADRAVIQGDAGDGFRCFIKTDSGQQAANFKFTNPDFRLP